jgi:hypothetical protein
VANKEVELAEEERDEAEEQLGYRDRRRYRIRCSCYKRQNKLLQATSQVMYIQDFVHR